MARATTSTSTGTESGAAKDGPTHRDLAGSERWSGRARERGLAGHIVMLAGSALAAALLVVGACWMAWSFAAAVPEPPASSAPRPDPTAPSPRGPRIRTASPDAIHTDVFFGVKQTRLSADAVAVLQDTAARIREEGGTWRALVQGHADGQGAAAYNLALAQRRAEAVRQFLVELGLSADDIRVVTIGQAGALCDDASPACQQLNRRVHLEVRRMAQASAPAARAVPAAPILGEEER